MIEDEKKCSASDSSRQTLPGGSRVRAKSIIGLVAIAILAALLVECSSSEISKDVSLGASQEKLAPAEGDTGAPPPPVIDPAKIENMKEIIRNEPKVIDFIYDPAAVIQWTIGVKDDGTPRWGYAEYFCLRLSEIGLSGQDNRVRIVDYDTYMRLQGDSQSASLGTVDCESGRHDVFR